MAKKSFKENPALSFISQALTESPPSQDNDNSSRHTHAYTHEHDDISTHNSTDNHTHNPTHTSNSTYVSSPKKRSSSQRNASRVPVLLERGESKSKRLQLLMRPSTHKGIAELAKQYHTSVNDIINQIIEDYLHNVEL